MIMYKASIEIARINKGLKLKFGLIITGENEDKNSKLVNKFNYNGSKYIKISPRPFVTLDISGMSPKSEGWNIYQFINFNKISLFTFIQYLEFLIGKYKEVKDLYYYDNEILKVNNAEADKLTMRGISSNKQWLMRPCVVPDDEVEERMYEGCMFCISKYENFCYITYGEMKYLLHELKHIDMIALSLHLINTVKLYDQLEEENIEVKPLPAPKEEDYNKETTKFVKMEMDNTIPEI